MNLFDPEPFEQIPGQMSLDQAEAPERAVSARLTYREKRERKAERLREWADGREVKGDAAHAGVKAISDRIPFGQPILVGHHSERGARADQRRMQNGMDTACENWEKAGDMRSRAENIDRQNAEAIYSDDADAVERLAGKIARLEAERDEIKRLNTAARKGTLTDAEKLILAHANRHAPIAGKGGGFPAYHLTNLSGNISRLRKRLAELQAPERGRWLVSRYASECRKCGAETAKGDRVLYFKRSHAVECEACQS